MWTLVALLAVWLVASPLLAVLIGRTMAQVTSFHAPSPRRHPQPRISA